MFVLTGCPYVLSGLNLEAGCNGFPQGQGKLSVITRTCVSVKRGSTVLEFDNVLHY